jgi:hypothetical protein
MSSILSGLLQTQSKFDRQDNSLCLALVRALAVSILSISWPSAVRLSSARRLPGRMTTCQSSELCKHTRLFSYLTGILAKTHISHTVQAIVNDKRNLLLVRAGS